MYAHGYSERATSLLPPPRYKEGASYSQNTGILICCEDPEMFWSAEVSAGILGKTPKTVAWVSLLHKV